MSTLELDSPAEDALRLVELAEEALRARSFEEFAEGVLPVVAGMMQPGSALLYVSDSQLPAPYFFQHGFQPEAVSEMENLCAEQFDRISSQAGLQPVVVYASPLDANLTLHPLQAEEGCIGLIGLMAREDATSPGHWERLFRLLANTISRLAESVRIEKQIAHLNTYLTVSSLIAQPLGLHELLEIALYCCRKQFQRKQPPSFSLTTRKGTFVSARSRDLKSRYWEARFFQRIRA